MFPDLLTHVRRVAFALLAGLALASTSACRASAPLPPASASASDLRPTVILLSIDGWRWDYHTKADVPNLRRLIVRGVHADALIPAFPSKTFPNHYTIVTGLYPGHHGVVGNNMREPGTPLTFSIGDRRAVTDARWWGGEPLWVTAKRQGHKVAPLFWPGAEAPIGGMLPDYWKQFDDGVPNDARVDQLLEWLDLPADQRPTFLTGYFSNVDHAGHYGGPDSPELLRALGDADRALGRLLDGLASRGLLERVNVVVVSDHGMATLSPNRTIVLSDYLDVNAVDIVELSPNLAINPGRLTVDQIYRRLSGAHPRLRVYRREESPPHWRFRDHPRIPAIVGVADEGWSVVRRRSVPSRVLHGNHGYDPQVRSMHGLFVAAGPAFRRGATVPAFESVHVYNVLARILGVTPAPNDGDPAIAEQLLTGVGNSANVSARAAR
ncbi:MAG TPA: ectonucleotide pyrophosphatase/phosphodiesterase [Vicinamibacterales bacterium]